MPGDRDAGRDDGLRCSSKRRSQHGDLSMIPAEERRKYSTARRARSPQCSTGTGVRGWSTAARITNPLPTWVLGPAPRVHVPARVIWGRRGKALLPAPARRNRRGRRRRRGLPPPRRRPFARGRRGEKWRRRSSPPGWEWSLRLQGRRLIMKKSSILVAFRRPARRRAGALPAGNGGHANRRACSMNFTITVSARRSRGGHLRRRRDQLLSPTEFGRGERCGATRRNRRTDRRAAGRGLDSSNDWTSRCRRSCASGATKLVARAQSPTAPASSVNISMSPTPSTTSARRASSTACSTPSPGQRAPPLRALTRPTGSIRGRMASDEFAFIDRLRLIASGSRGARPRGEDVCRDRRPRPDRRHDCRRRPLPVRPIICAFVGWKLVAVKFQRPRRQGRGADCFAI